MWLLKAKKQKMILLQCAWLLVTAVSRGTMILNCFSVTYHFSGYIYISFFFEFGLSKFRFSFQTSQSET